MKESQQHSRGPVPLTRPVAEKNFHPKSVLDPV